MNIRMLTTYASPHHDTHNADSLWLNCPDDIGQGLVDGGYAIREDPVIPTAAEVLKQAEEALAAARTSVELATAAVEAHESVVASLESDEEPEPDAPIEPPEGEEFRTGDSEDDNDEPDVEPDVETAAAAEEGEDADEKPQARPRRPSRN